MNSGAALQIVMQYAFARQSPILRYVLNMEGSRVVVPDGRNGLVVTTPWLGNLWHLRLQVNVPSNSPTLLGPIARKREWVSVWRWQTGPYTEEGSAQ